MRNAVKLFFLSCVAIFMVARCNGECVSDSSPYAAGQRKVASDSSDGECVSLERKNFKLMRENEYLMAERDKALWEKTVAEGKRDKAIIERDEALKEYKKSKPRLWLLLGVIAGIFLGIGGWMGFAMCFSRIGEKR